MHILQANEGIFNKNWPQTFAQDENFTKLNVLKGKNKHIADQEKIDELHEKGAKLQLAALDHVSSLPSVLFPIKELVKMCREAGFERIFVDGCHALGTVADLHVPAIGADFYAGNVCYYMLLVFD